MFQPINLCSRCPWAVTAIFIYYMCRVKKGLDNNGAAFSAKPPVNENKMNTKIYIR